MNLPAPHAQRQDRFPRPAPGRPATRADRGFTLVEIMVVLVLIGIMAAMIIPEMKGTYEDALLRSTARKLVDVFHLANSRAITVNQLHRVRLDLKEGHCVIERPARESEGRGGFVPERDLPGGESKLDTRIAIEVDKAGEAPGETPAEEPRFVSGDDLRNPRRGEVISFYPDGTADKAKLILRDREGFRLGLQINPTTARVRIVELERQ